MIDGGKVSTGERNNFRPVDTVDPFEVQCLTGSNIELPFAPPFQSPLKI